MKHGVILKLLESMNIEKRLADILLYAIGMINTSQLEQEDEQNEVKTIDFF